jgi:hypothetical protein
MADTFSKLTRRPPQPALEPGAPASAQGQDEETKAKSAPPCALGQFRKLPKELISRVSFYLPPGAVFKFARASKSLHRMMATSGPLNSLRLDKFKTIHATNNAHTYESAIKAGAVSQLLEWLEKTHSHPDSQEAIVELAAMLPNHINSVCGCLNGQGNFILLQLIGLSRKLKPDARDRVLLTLHQSLAALGCEGSLKESLAAEKLRIEWKQNVESTFGDAICLADVPPSAIERSATPAICLDTHGTIDIYARDGTWVGSAANLSEVKRALATVPDL